MNNTQLVAYVKAIHANQHNTVYILGGIGRVLTNDFINRRIAMGDKLTAGKQTWLRTQVGKYSYDCVGLIKSMLWTGNKPFGAITYNAAQDQNVSMMWNAAKEKATMTGENHPDIPGLLVMTADLGHVGVYIGRENGRKAYIEATVTDGVWRVIKSYGYLGRRNVEWTRWAKYSLITYASTPKPTPTPKPDPVQPSGGVIAETGYQLVLKTDVWERSNPTLNNPAGKALRKKGEKLPYVAYQQINGYDWKKLTSGKWIPAGPIGNTTEYASIEKIPVVVPKPNPVPTPTPKPPVSSGMIAETGYQLVLKTDVWERNNPTLDDGSGKVLRKKGERIPYVGYQQINGYDWKKLPSGKWIPAGPIGNTNEYASIEKIAASVPKSTTDEYGMHLKVGQVIYFSTMSTSVDGGTIFGATDSPQRINTSYVTTIKVNGKDTKVFVAKLGKVYPKSQGYKYPYEVLTRGGSVLGRVNPINIY